MLQHKVLLHLS